MCIQPLGRATLPGHDVSWPLCAKGLNAGMQDKRVFVFPLIFAIVLVPVMIAALLIFRPGASQADCDCSAAQPSYASHAHGLALAREIAQANGGEVSAANDREGGAVFVVVLPLA